MAHQVDKKFTHNEVKQTLEQLISAFVESNRPVELANDFFVKASIRIIKKNRNRPKKRLLIREQDTTQENISAETTKFQFKTSFEETTSVSLATSQGFTASIGGGLSGGAAGASLGLSSGLEYSKSKSFGQDKSRAQIKELTTEVEVHPLTVVIVKELTYEVEWAAMCDLELILRKEHKIEYTCTGKWGKKHSKSIEGKNLLKRLNAKRKKVLDSIQRAEKFSPKSNTALTEDQHGLSAVEQETDPSPKSNTSLDLARDPFESSAVTEPNLLLPPGSNTAFTEDQHGLSAVEQTSPMPPSPKSNTSLDLARNLFESSAVTEHNPLPSPNSNTAFTEDQHGWSAVEQETDPSPKSNSSFDLARDPFESSAVTENNPLPPPKSNTAFTEDQHGPSAVEQTSPTPPSPKSNTSLDLRDPFESPRHSPLLSPNSFTEDQHGLSAVEQETDPSPNSLDLPKELPRELFESSPVIKHRKTPKSKSVQFQGVHQLITNKRDPSPDPNSLALIMSTPVRDPADVIADPRLLLTENMLAIEFTSDCLFSAEEHKLEVIQMPSNTDRVQRIIEHQIGVADQNDREDMLLSLINDRYAA